MRPVTCSLSTILASLLVTAPFVFTLPSNAQVGTLEEIISSGRGGSEPEYIRLLMYKFETELKQFVISRNIRSPKEILNLFGTMVAMIREFNQRAILVGYNRYNSLLEDNPFLSDSGGQTCEILENAWSEIENHQHGILFVGPNGRKYEGTFLNDVHTESLELYARELDAGLSPDQALAVRYRFAEWKILNDMLGQATDWLAMFYAHPRFEPYESTRWVPTAKHPHPHCDSEWCDCSHYPDQTGWYEEVPNGIITNPMVNPCEWFNFRTKHFNLLSRDAWVFIAPWFGVIDVLMFGPAIVQFNVGRLSRASPISLLPAEMVRTISMLVAPPLCRK